MSKVRCCPFCDGIMDKKGDKEYACVRCSLKVSTDTDMTEEEFCRRFNRRVSEKRECTTTMDAFIRKDAGTELLRVLHDYQPCTKEEILRRRGWLEVYMEKNLCEAIDLNLVKSVFQDGHEVYLLTDVGKMVFREVTT